MYEQSDKAAIYEFLKKCVVNSGGGMSTLGHDSF